MVPQVRANEWPETLFYSKPFLALVLSFDSLCPRGKHVEGKLVQRPSAMP
ncbi:hypothetical protein Hanom_Chr14g01283881 [Helianthus anomalus]